MLSNDVCTEMNFEKQLNLKLSEDKSIGIASTDAGDNKYSKAISHE